MIDVLLINPGDQPSLYQGLSAEFTAKEPPLWCRLLASYLRWNGVQVSIVDQENAGLTHQDVLERTGTLSPGLVAVVVHGHQPSASTQKMGAAIELCRHLCDAFDYTAGPPVMILGGHVAALPERAMLETGADLGCTGEGFVTLLELVKRELHELNRVPGLVYYRDGELVINPPAPNVWDLTMCVPTGSWQFLNMDLYRAHNWHCLQEPSRTPYASIYTSLGCPHKCHFCLEKGTTIITGNGPNRKIQNIKVGDTLFGYDLNGKSLVETTVISTGHRFVDEILEISLEHGETIRVTGEHPLLMDGIWVRADEIKVGDCALRMAVGDKKTYLAKKRITSYWSNPKNRKKQSDRWKNGGYPRMTLEKAAKISATCKAKADTLRRLMLKRISEGMQPVITKEGRARISERMKKNNPMKDPAVASKVSATLKEKHSDFYSQQLKARWAAGKMPKPTVSSRQRLASSIRMRNNNPMKNPAVAFKVSAAVRKGIARGTIVPYMCTEEGRKVISEIATRRAWSEDNPGRGAKNPRYIDGRSELKRVYPRKFSPALKRSILKRDGRTCQNCGGDYRLNVHHVDHNKDNNDPCNLVTLCAYCHPHVHRKAERVAWQTYFMAKLASAGQCPSYTKVASIKRMFGKFKVYNLQCSPYDNYFAARVSVHNCNIQNPFQAGDVLKFKGKANSYRMWSPEAVAEEVQYLYDVYGVTNIKIADEMYVLNRAHVLGIADELIRRGIADKLNFWAYARVDTLNDTELLERMRAGGVKWVCVGIESMSEYVRDGINKNDYTMEDIFKACARLKAAGINLIANFMFGLPDDTLESMEQTFRLGQELKPEWWNGYAVVAYPGTALHREVVANGWELPKSWDGYSHHAKGYLPLRTKYLTAREVLRFRDQAFQRFFTDPDFLKRTEAKFGAAACQGVIDMTGVKLERDNG